MSDFQDMSVQLRSLSENIQRKVRDGKFPPPSEFMASVCKVCHGTGFARYFKFGQWGVKRCEGWQSDVQYADDEYSNELQRTRCLGANYEEWVRTLKRSILTSIWKHLHYKFEWDDEIVFTVCNKLSAEMVGVPDCERLTHDQLEILYYRIINLTEQELERYAFNEATDTQDSREALDDADVYGF